MGKGIFFNLPGATGHINPTLDVVRSLVARGEEIIYYADPVSAPKVAATGAVVRDYRPILDYMHSEECAKDAYTAFETILELFRTCALPLREQVARDKPDYILYAAPCPWGKYIAQSLGIPAICTNALPIVHPLLMFADIGTLKESFKIALQLRRGLRLIAGIREVVRSMGCSTMGLVDQFADFLRNRGDLNIVFTTTAFHPFARFFKKDYLFVGPSLVPHLDTARAEVPRSRPLLYVSLGTVQNNRPEFYRDCFAAFGDADMDVVMSVGQTVDLEALGKPPANFTVARRVDQLAILQEASCFITHGGMNSLQEAFYYGVPTLVVPQQLEQALNGRITRRQRAGLLLPPEKATPAALRQAVGRLLREPRFRLAARRLGEAGRRAGGAARAADEIIAFLARLRRTHAGSQQEAMRQGRPDAPSDEEMKKSRAA
jgi:MGT family glycosyltransferase